MQCLNFRYQLVWEAIANLYYEVPPYTLNDFWPQLTNNTQLTENLSANSLTLL